MARGSFWVALLVSERCGEPAPSRFNGEQIKIREQNAYSWKCCAECESTGRRGRGNPSSQGIALHVFVEGDVAGRTSKGSQLASSVLNPLTGSLAWVRYHFVSVEYVD